MKRIPVWILAAVLVSVPVASADAPDTTDGTLDFGLTDTETQSEQNVNGAVSMLAEQPGSGDEVQIPVTGNQLWVADQVTDVDFIIEDGTTALVHLDVGPLLGSTDVTVELGQWSDGSGFASAGSTTQTVSEQGVHDFEVTLDEQSFTTDVDRPALRTSSSDLLVDVNVNEQTAVHYQDVPPPEDYPTPELGSLVLSGIGLLGVLGLARFRHEE